MTDLLPKETSRTFGREAQRANIHVARLVAETVRTTLGPKGMDKMIVDEAGDVTVTNDGVTILEEMRIEHPTGKMIVEIAKTQEHEVGDGTTTAVVLAGELLKRAEALLDQEVHPTIIARGYHRAAEHAQELLATMAEQVTGVKLLTQVASTATTGKGTESAKEQLARIVVDAVEAVATEEGVRRGDIKIVQKTGNSVDETALITGLVLDKERVHAGMPERVTNAKLLLLDTPLEVRQTETDAKISITNPEQLQGFLDMEAGMLKKMTDAIVASGASVVVCQKGIDEVAQHELAKAGILALRRVTKRDLEHLAKATGARIVSNLDDLTKGQLGTAGLVEQRSVADEPVTVITDCKHPRAVTILVRGGTEHVAAEVARAMEDAVGVVAAARESGAVVAGAGAPELALAKGLRQYAATLTGREQLAVQAFADAMEVIPRTLAENAGIDPIDALTALKAAHESGERWAGIDIATGEKLDAWKAGIIEPLKIKTQAVSSASEVATMILRIDDVIDGTRQRDAQPEPALE